MRGPLLKCFLAVLLLSEAGISYEITKVIEVGPANGLPVVRPLNWSPDGSQLAYFHNGSLRVSDTLGTSRVIVTLDIAPFRAEWLSGRELLIHTKKQLPGDTELNRIVCVEIDSSRTRTVREYKRTPGARPEDQPESFSGPFRSLEGVVFYRTNVIQATTRRHSRDRERVVLETDVTKKGTDASALAENHFVDWGQDGLYKISCDLRDSVRLARAAAPNRVFPPTVDKPLTYYLDGGVLCRFADSTFIVLDTIPKEFPPLTGAVACMHGSFNPSAPEILFTLIFHDADEYEIFNVATFNYATNVLTVVDDLIDMHGCNSPTYAPDGMKIAFLCSGKVIIVFRGGTL
ncbi:MAG: hypothetical protein AB1644_04870 [Candidatus Zixiibacteriota bacterium]